MHRGELKTLEEVQELWGTTQTSITIPTKELIYTKHMPTSLYIALSMVSASTHIPCVDNQERDMIRGRYIGIKYLNRAINLLIDLQPQLMTKKIKKNINDLLGQKSKEFEFVATKEDFGWSYTYNMYYELGKFITLDIRLAYYLIANLNDGEIQAYLILCTLCRDWRQITQEYLAEAMGLSKHSRRKVGTILKRLEQLGLIKKFTENGKKLIPNSKGVLVEITTQINEYRITEPKELLV